MRSTSSYTSSMSSFFLFSFFFQAEDGIRDLYVTGVQTCALPILGYGTVVQLLLSGFITFIVGGPVGSFILGVYLFVSIRIFGRHGNEAFSSLRIADYKHWLRMKIDATGGLTLYAIALDRVPRHWRPATRNGEATQEAHDARASAPRLIDR